MKKRKNFRKKRPKERLAGLQVRVYDNNVEKAKQAGVNLKHDYSNQVEKIQHELDLKRHAEEAALQVELNQLRHLKSEALAHEFCQKRELVQKNFNNIMMFN